MVFTKDNMQTENNILDKVIQSEADKKKADLNPQELVNFLLKDLNSREKEVIKARYGLDRGKSQTLESIGKTLGITRERVRQIESNGLRKAYQAEDWQEKLQNLLSLAIKNINKSGYIRLEEALLNELLENSQEIEIDKNCLRFIFNKFLIGQLEPVNIVHTDRAWKVGEVDLNHYEPLIEGIKNILIKKNEPLTIQELASEIEKEIIDVKVKDVLKELEDLELALYSYLEVSQHFRKNLFEKWGLKEWRTVNPKRMRDKIYLVLSKDKEPLHYRKITDRINEEMFDNKVAHPATIHNELILDDRFVLIGRGIYALAEWGYKPGVIAEVIREILQEAGQPMTKEEIAVEVLKHRVVKPGSINLILADKNLFKKLPDGKYSLVS